MKHRREIDGLRAFAIIPVLLFHAGFAWMPGGYLGVDIFFVISGFLICGIIANQIQSTGRFDVVLFYERRARRIMPALFVVMAATAVAANFILFPKAWATFLKSLVSMTYFGSNYYFLGVSGYFDPDIDLNPMLHTWSLAIEEQFYVFFPFLLWFLWKRVGLKRAVWVLGILALVSLVWANFSALADPNTTFYVLQFRAWELFAGAIAALILLKRQEPFSNNLLSGVGLVAIVASVFFLGTDFPHPGFWTLLPVGGSVLVVLFAGDGTLVRRVLSFKFFVGIGLISYSLYLWHQPIFSLFRVLSAQDQDPVAFIPLIALSVLLAALSWKFVESPFRQKGRFGRRQIFTWTAVLLALTVALAYVGTRQTFQNLRVSISGQKFSNVEDRLDTNHGLSKDCEGFEPSAEECISGSNPTVLLWGDSYARQMGLALKNSPTHVSFIQQTKSGCAPILGLASQSERNGREFAKACIKFNDQMLAWLKKHKEIKTVILGSPWTAAIPENLSAGRDLVARTTGQAGLRAMANTFEAVKNLGVEVVATFPTPRNLQNGGKCIVATLAQGGDLKNCNWPLSENTLAGFEKSLAPLEEIVPFWSWDPILCPDQICLVTQGDLFVYIDFGHISKEATTYFGAKYDIMGQLLKLAAAGPKTD